MKRLYFVLSAVITILAGVFFFISQQNSNISSISNETLVAHFSNQSFAEKYQQLIEEFFVMNDSVQTAAFIKLHRHRFRKLLPLALNQITLHQELNYPHQNLIAISRIEQLVSSLKNYLHEYAGPQQISWFKNANTQQRIDRLATRYLTFKGDSLHRTGEYEAAIRNFEGALEYCRKSGNIQGEVQIYYKKGKTLANLEKFLDSINSFRKSVTLAANHSNPLMESWGLIRIGMVQGQLKNYSDSEKALVQAINLSKRFTFLKENARAKSTLGFIYAESGRLFESLDMLEQSLKIFSRLGRSIEETIALNYLGTTYRLLGDYVNARKMYEQGLANARQLQRPRFEASMLNNLGLICGELGEHQRSLRYYQNALTLFKDYGTEGDIAVATANTGEAFANLGKIEQAFEYLDQALAFEENPDYAVRRAETYQMCGYTLLKNNDYEKAREYFNKALQAHQQKNFLNGLILTHLGLGQIELAEKKWHKAEQEFGSALDDMKQSGISAHAWVGLFGKGLALKESGYTEKAISFYKAAIDSIEAARSNIQLERSMIDYFVDKQEVYDELIAIYLNRKRNLFKAFEYAERAKARVFNDIVHGQVDIISKEAPDGSAQLDLKLNAGGTLQTPALQELQKHLTEKDKLIVYRLLKDRLAIWILKRDGLQFQESLVDRETLRQKVRAFRQAMGADDYRTFQNNVYQNGQETFNNTLLLARELSSHLIEPLRNAINQQTNLYIIPDDILHYLPFAALPHPRDAKEKFLIESATITIAPSVAILLHTLTTKKKNTLKKTETILAVSDPVGDLPWAARTAKFITNLFNGSKLFEGHSADKDSIIAAVEKGYDILHFGTHFRINERIPLYSALQLASSKDNIATAIQSQVRSAEDHNPRSKDNLRMHEVFAFDLEPTRLVVLSACETGLGQFARGEGFVGIARAFIYAGAPAIMTTLWQVDDNSTARLMQNFYQHLYSGEDTIAEALQKAQVNEIQKLRQDKIVKYPHPYFWAPFVMVGHSGML